MYHDTVKSQKFQNGFLLLFLWSTVATVLAMGEISITMDVDYSDNLRCQKAAGKSLQQLDTSLRQDKALVSDVMLPHSIGLNTVLHIIYGVLFV